MNVRTTISVGFFCSVALLSFSVWAFGGALFSSEPMMYAGCAAVFLGLGGPALLPASGFRRKSAISFCAAFAVSYCLYALIWSVAWFSLPNTFGEIIGSLLGLTAFALAIRKWMKLTVPLLTGVSILFLFHTVGYYAGGFAYEALQGRGPAGITLSWSPKDIRLCARLSWGLFYGIGLGLGICKFLYLSRQSSDSPSTHI